MAMRDQRTDHRLQLLKVVNTRPPRLSQPQADDGGQVEQQNKEP